MPHDVSLISTVAAALGLALILGFLATKLRLPALVGYMLAGVVIGPATPGFVADLRIASQLAEIGVMLLMFGVGLHFSLDDLLAVRRIALPGAVVQMAVATALGAGVATWWGWSIGGALVFGLSLSVASTVVLLKALERRGALQSENGRIAVGWLVVEDLATVLVLVLLPAVAGWLGGAQAAPGSQDLASAALTTLALVAAYVAIMLVVGRRVFPWLLWQVARTGSRELFTLCVIAAAVGIAFASAELFGVSFALGAFFAGMVLRESTLSHRAAEETLPLRDAFAVLFFVSVGMLFQPAVIVERPGQLAAVVAIILFGKTIAAALLVLAFRYPLNTALIVSASLAQIGEFSFILAALGVSLGLMPEEARSLIVAGALISIAANPFVFAAIEPAQRWMLERSALARSMAQREDPLGELPATVDPNDLTGQVVIVGYGRVGRRIADALRAHGIPFVVADHNRALVESMRGRGFHAVAGDAAQPETLVQAHVARAAVLVIATPETQRVRPMIETARMLNPAIGIVVRTHDEQVAALLSREESVTVFDGETELASAMAARVLDEFALRNRAGGAHPKEAGHAENGHDARIS
jgi:CPA2 family monovalent cation:H+ antiporter-2